MAVYRVNKDRSYTVMANFHLRDKSLSLKAVGLLSKMLSFNDGWKFSTRGLSAICKEGPDAIQSALRELEKHGYLVRHRTRDSKGRMSCMVFEMDGNGPTQIARMLKEDHVLTPTVYQDRQKRKVRCTLPENPYNWNGSTVAAILERMEYCGHTVNFKTHRQSYKIKKTIENPPEQWKIFRNTHEAIVDEDTFQRVQELRRNKRRPARTGKSNLFSGVAYCADCGEKMYYCTSRNFEERQDHFVCSTSRKKGKDVCGTHFIRAVVLEKGVLKFLQILLWYISNCEDLFRDKLGAKRKEDFKKELAAKRRQLMQAQRRMEELDRLFKQLYEDNISGKINDSRFEKLSADYENEQAELTEKMQLLEQEIAQQEEEADSIEQFILRAKKYPNLQELTPAVLHDLVNRVYVSAPDKSSGQRVQDVHISLACIGFLPESIIAEMLIHASKSRTA